MRFRPAAALALVGWHLLEPPFKASASFASNGKYDAVSEAPLSKWYHVASFDEARLCEMARHLRTAASKDAEANGGHKVVAAIGQYAECIATDDPRLKGGK
jgi:hypothetical protein